MPPFPRARRTISKEEAKVKLLGRVGTAKPGISGGAFFAAAAGCAFRTTNTIRTEFLPHNLPYNVERRPSVNVL